MIPFEERRRNFIELTSDFDFIGMDVKDAIDFFVRNGFGKIKLINYNFYTSKVSRGEVIIPTDDEKQFVIGNPYLN